MLDLLDVGELVEVEIEHDNKVGEGGIDPMLQNQGRFTASLLRQAREYDLPRSHLL